MCLRYKQSTLGQFVVALFLHTVIRLASSSSTVPCTRYLYQVAAVPGKVVDVFEWCDIIGQKLTHVSQTNTFKGPKKEGITSKLLFWKKSDSFVGIKRTSHNCLLIIIFEIRQNRMVHLEW